MSTLNYNMTAKQINTATKRFATTLSDMIPKIHAACVSAVRLHASNGDVRPMQAIVDCLAANPRYKSEVVVWFKKNASVTISGSRIKHDAKVWKKDEVKTDVESVSFKDDAKAKTEERKQKRERDSGGSKGVVDPMVTLNKSIRKALEVAEKKLSKVDILAVLKKFEGQYTEEE